MDPRLLFGIGMSVVSLCVRWRLPVMSKPIATAGVIVGLGLICWSFWPRLPVPLVGGIIVALAVTGALVELLLDWTRPSAAAAHLPHAHAVDVPASAANDEPGLVGPSITPAYLSDIYRDRTHIQADKLAATFIGKRIEVSGAVAIVTALDGTQTTLSVEMDRDTEGFSTTWMLFEGDRERLEMLRHGDRITVVGRIKAFDRGELQLIDCRLASVG